jgi:hypothetical protein
MCHSLHDHRFCHSRCHFLLDCCLTHCCHCSTNAIANTATNATATTHHPPKLLPTSCCCHFNHYRCAKGAAFVFTRQCLSFFLAGCRVACSCTTSLPLNVLTLLDVHCLPFTRLVVAWVLVVLQPLDTPLPFDAPSGCCVASHYAALLFAPADCGITSCCTALASQHTRPHLLMCHCLTSGRRLDLLFTSC